jgi:hypothetical protein
VDEVKNKVGVEIFDDKVENAKVDLSQAPAGPPKGPMVQPPRPRKPGVLPPGRPPGARPPRIVTPPGGAKNPAPVGKPEPNK